MTANGTVHFFREMLASYRGVVTIIAVFLVGMLAQHRIGVILDAPVIVRHQQHQLDSLKQEVGAIRIVHDDITKDIKESKELLLEIACSNEETKIKFWWLCREHLRR